MNPCPCGYAGDPKKECTCSPGMVAKYQNRIDIHLEVQRVCIAKLASLDSGESSRVIREQVEAARARQPERFAPMGKPNLLLSARAYHRVFKLARTTADLAGEETIRPLDLAEALQYRPRGGVQPK